MNKNLVIISPENFFKEQISTVVEKRNIKTNPLVLEYVSGMLIKYLVADNFFSQNENGQKEQPTLAWLLKDAIEAESEQKKDKYQRLGDVSLFMAGFFPGFFSRKLIDVDYYIGMGGSAYLEVAYKTRGAIFYNLAQDFSKLVDVLSEVSELSNASNEDLLRIYELWQITKSPRLYEKLIAKGILPLSSSINKS